MKRSKARIATGGDERPLSFWDFIRWAAFTHSGYDGCHTHDRRRPEQCRGLGTLRNCVVSDHALRLDRHPRRRLPGDDPRGDLEAQQAARPTRCGENHSPGTALGSVDGRSCGLVNVNRLATQTLRATNRATLWLEVTGSPSCSMDLRLPQAVDSISSGDRAMRCIRFNIASLLIVVLFVAVGFAALRESNDLWDSGLFTLTLTVLLVSMLLAIHRTEARRAFWIGFALFGWIYLGLSLVPSIESRLLTTKAIAYLDSKVPGRSQRSSPSSLRGLAQDASRNSNPESRLHRTRESTRRLQPGWGEALGCGDGQAPRRLDWHSR